jgi:hypothetical protein
MAWNHRDNIVAIGVALQVSAGVFVAPGAADLMGVANIGNTRDPITADDPTVTGTVWNANRILIGKSGSVNFNFPIRGPGGVAPPAGDEWPMGRVLQAAGWAEIVNAAAIVGDLQAGSSTSVLALAAGASGVDDLYIGAPIQLEANALGIGPVRGYALITDYDGTSKEATIAELVGGGAPAAGVEYTLPPFLLYQLGTLVTAPPLLSVSVWRDKLRYDYVDCRPQSLNIDAPVGNEYNTGFPSIECTLRGKLVAVVQDTTPPLPDAILQTPVPPAKAGKFVLDRVPLGHAGLTWQVGSEIGAPSNQNQDDGIDGYEIMSGDRTLAMDLNQMDIADFDFESREDAQTVMPVESIWGAGAGNRFGLLLPGVVMNPLNPGSRNGFVSLTGDAFPTSVDKSAALAIWW